MSETSSTKNVAPSTDAVLDTNSKIDVECNEPLCESSGVGHQEWYSAVEAPDPLHRHCSFEGDNYSIRIERYDSDADWDICVDVDHNNGEFDGAGALKMADHLKEAARLANRLNGIKTPLPSLADIARELVRQAI
jgi:predicted dehydrogenase